AYPDANCGLSRRSDSYSRVSCSTWLWKAELSSALPWARASANRAFWCRETSVRRCSAMVSGSEGASAPAEPVARAARAARTRAGRGCISGGRDPVDSGAEPAFKKSAPFATGKATLIALFAFGGGWPSLYTRGTMGQTPSSDCKAPSWAALLADVAGTAVGRFNDIVMVTEAEPLEEPGLRILYVNPAFERITGYAAEEVLGRSPRFLQGPRTSVDEIGRIGAALRARKPFRAELLNYRKDGSTFWVEIEASSMNGPLGGSEFFIFIERDITERKKAEGTLRAQEQAMTALLSNLPGMAYRCRTDSQWTKEFVSAGCATLTGYRPEDLVGNQLTNFEEIIHPEDRKGVRDAVAAATGADGFFELTYRIRTRDGAMKWVLDRGRVLQNLDGATRALEGFILDITERKLLETQVVQNQRLESIGILAGGIAHDLNNILAPIMMAGDLLQDKA